MQILPLMVIGTGCRFAFPQEVTMTGPLRAYATRSLGFFLLAICVSTASAQTTYTITDLGTLGDNPFSFGFSLNGVGQVTGSSNNLGSIGNHGFLYSAGTMTDLGVLDPDPADLRTFSVGRGINESGQVTGTATAKIDGVTEPHAFVYSQGTMQDLGTLGGNTSNGYGINDSGEATGSADLAGNTGTHAFLYSNGHTHDLGTLPGYDGSTGLGINNAGQVTGFLSATGTTQAFLYSGGQITDLGTLGGSLSQGSAINRYGQIAGGSTLVPNTQYVGATHAFLYSGGKMRDLGTLGGTSSYAFGINSFGQVVGWSDTRSGVVHAFLYTPGRGMLDLNRLLPRGSEIVLSGAAAINDAGQITGGATVASGAIHAFLLSPPPSVMLTNLIRSYQLPRAVAHSLETKLRSARSANVGSGAYCSGLDEFTAKVQSLVGTYLTQAQAGELIAVANQLRSSANCY